MYLSNRPRPPGFTLTDTLAVILIIVIVVMIGAPYLMKMRLKSDDTACLNKMRQLGLATHHHQDDHGSMPPGYGPVGEWPKKGSAYGTVFFHLLPYLDQTTLFESAHVANGIEDCYWWAHGNPAAVYGKPIRQLRCPADPSMPEDGRLMGWGASSYAFNAQVFCKIGEDGSVLSGPDWHQGTTTKGASSVEYPKLPDSFGDGASNVILFAERYAQCGGAPVQAGHYANLWSYPFNGHDHCPYFAARAGYVYDPVAGTLPNGAIHTVRFQIQPDGYATTNCNPHRASSGHQKTLNVCAGDASTHALPRSLSASTFWAAVSPNGRDCCAPLDGW